MTPELQLQRKMRTELRRQVATAEQALARLEGLDSEETGRCFITEAVRRRIKSGNALLNQISRVRIHAKKNSA